MLFLECGFIFEGEPFYPELLRKRHLYREIRRCVHLNVPDFEVHVGDFPQIIGCVVENEAGNDSLKTDKQAHEPIFPFRSFIKVTIILNINIRRIRIMLLNPILFLRFGSLEMVY